MMAPSFFSRLSTLLLLLAAPLAAPLGAQEAPAGGEKKAPGAEIPLDFRKLEKKSSVAPGALVKPGTHLPSGMGPSDRSRPSREEPPLPPEPEAEKGQDGAAAPKESRRRPDYDLYAEASEAAEWAAEWQVRRHGLPEFYRVGAWQGLRDAIERSMDSSFAFEDGLEDGERDPRAARSGGSEGERAAVEEGERAARAAVEKEFRDLAREPRRNPRLPDVPLPEDLIEVREPRLEDAFADVSVGSYLSYEGFDRYVDPWQLYGATSWGQVYDSAWDSDRDAFDHWRDRGDDAIWDRLSRPEQDYFRRTFADQLDYYRSQELRFTKSGAFDEGYDDGWDYGARVGAELRYRQGYHQGFLETATGAAETAWNEVFPEAYGREYRAEFEAWSSSARPEIAQVLLFDQNDDGIFEPGEPVKVALELANYGGRDIQLALGAEGRALAAPAAGPATTRPLALRRRSSAKAELAVTLDPGQPPRTRTDFEVVAGELREQVPILVSRPLELDPKVTYGRLSSLDGTASLEAAVWNRSRKNVAGSLDVWVGDRRIAGPGLESLQPGSRRAVALEVDGIDGLALLEGAAEVRLELKSREVVQDELLQKLPAIGLDLASGELDAFWLEAVYGDFEVSRAGGVRIVELLARRMAADWEVQRKASGNPYKEDLEKGQGRSALGALVRAVAAERRPARRSDLKKALATRLKVLAEKLPGTHPFLRGSFKKLGAKLG